MDNSAKISELLVARSSLFDEYWALVIPYMGAIKERCKGRLRRPVIDKAKQPTVDDDLLKRVADKYKEIRRSIAEETQLVAEGKGSEVEDSLSSEEEAEQIKKIAKLHRRSTTLVAHHPSRADGQSSQGSQPRPNRCCAKPGCAESAILRCHSCKHDWYCCKSSRFGSLSLSHVLTGLSQ